MDLRSRYAQIPADTKFELALILTYSLAASSAQSLARRRGHVAADGKHLTPAARVAGMAFGVGAAAVLALARRP
jgi:hypothetical protein